MRAIAHRKGDGGSEYPTLILDDLNVYDGHISAPPKDPEILITRDIKGSDELTAGIWISGYERSGGTELTVCLICRYWRMGVLWICQPNSENFVFFTFGSPHRKDPIVDYHSDCISIFAFVGKVNDFDNRNGGRRGDWEVKEEVIE